MFGTQPNGYLGIGDQSMMQIQPGDPPRQGGMFGNGGNLANILTSAAAGFLSRRSPQLAQSILQPMMLKQQQELQEKQYQAHHAQELQDQKDLLTFKSTLPINNDTANDYAFWQGKLTPEQFQQWVQSRIDPPQYMNVPGVGLVQVPRAAPSGPPTAPVGKLTPYVPGGPTQPASGGFPG